MVHCHGCGQEYDAYPEADWMSGGQKATEEHAGHIKTASLRNCQIERDDWLRTAFGVEG
jgi:hypothetical protein